MRRREKRSMRTDDRKLDWPAELYAPAERIFDEPETVRVLASGESSDLSFHREREWEVEPKPVYDEPAPLLKHVLTADDLHDQRIAALTEALQAGLNFLTLPGTGAKAWAKDLSYSELVTEHIEEATRQITTAMNLIDIREGR